MKENIGYQTYTDARSGNSEVEFFGDKDCQFIATDVYISSNIDSCLLEESWAMSMGLQPLKMVGTLIQGQSTMVLSSLAHNSLISEDLEAGDKIAIRSPKFTQVFSTFARVLNADPVTKIVTIDGTWDDFDVNYLSGGEVIVLDRDNIPMESDGAGGYHISRTGDGIFSTAKGSPALLTVYGTNTKIRICGYYDDIA